MRIEEDSRDIRRTKEDHRVLQLPATMPYATQNNITPTTSPMTPQNTTVHRRDRVERMKAIGQGMNESDKKPTRSGPAAEEPGIWRSIQIAELACGAIQAHR